MTRNLLGPFAFGALLALGCSGEDNREPVWSYISPAIIQPNCATTGCHSAASSVAGLDFSNPIDGFISMRLLHSSECNGDIPYRRAAVTPFEPNVSLIVNMMRRRGADPMPPDTIVPEADIELVEAWIANGALNDLNPEDPDGENYVETKVRPDLEVYCRDRQEASN